MQIAITVSNFQNIQDIILVIYPTFVEYFFSKHLLVYT